MANPPEYGERVEYGVRLRWDNGQTEDHPRESIYDAEQTVALHAHRRRVTPGWTARAELIRRTVTVGPWERAEQAEG